MEIEWCSLHEITTSRTLITPNTPNSQLFLEHDHYYEHGVLEVNAQDQAPLPGVIPPPLRPDYYQDLDQVTNIENTQYQHGV